LWFKEFKPQVGRYNYESIYLMNTYSAKGWIYKARGPWHFLIFSYKVSSHFDKSRFFWAKTICL